MLSSHRLWPARLSSSVVFIFNSSGRFQSVTDDPLRLLDDRREVALAAEALGINLVQALRSRRPGREPAAGGDDLQAADGGAVARRTRQLARDGLAGECGGPYRLRRKACDACLLLRRGRR